MLPLTVDDLLPLEEYAMRRKEFFDAHRRYVDRYRRVRIGPKLTLIFENRQKLNLYNRLLPTRNLLQSALLIEIADQAQLAKELAPWRSITGEHLKLHVGSAA